MSNKIRRHTIEKYYKQKNNSAARHFFAPGKKRGKRFSKSRKAEILRNKKLCKRYPWLIPRNNFTGEVCWGGRPYDNTLLDDMLKGWRIAFGDIWCEEMDKAIRLDSCADVFRIIQLKEKYGQLRCYTNVYSPNIKHVVNAFEVISEYICVYCGSIDAHIVNDRGWFWPLCRDCYKKDVVDKLGDDADPYEETNKDIMPDSYTLHTYNSKTKEDQYKTYDISDITTKIKLKYGKRLRRRNE